jgi:glycerol-3-phosphate acyltransferase PlsY
VCGFGRRSSQNIEFPARKGKIRCLSFVIYGKIPPPNVVFLAHYVFSLILAAALGYLIGSIPFAYLLVQWETKTDIRNQGSRNVGTLNSYVVTKSKLVALEVLVLDLSKGAVAVLLARLLFGADFQHGAVGGLSSVVGHSYPVWLGFRGGRGLAPSAGASFVLLWLVVPLWLLLWGAAFLLVRVVNPANAIASAVVLVAALVIPPGAWEWALREPAPVLWVRGSVIVLMAIILTRHVGPVQEYIQRGSS